MWGRACCFKNILKICFSVYNSNNPTKRKLQPRKYIENEIKDENNKTIANLNEKSNDLENKFEEKGM